MVSAFMMAAFHFGLPVPLWVLERVNAQRLATESHYASADAARAVAKKRRQCKAAKEAHEEERDPTEVANATAEAAAAGVRAGVEFFDDGAWWCVPARHSSGRGHGETLSITLAGASPASGENSATTGRRIMSSTTSRSPWTT